MCVESKRQEQHLMKIYGGLNQFCHALVFSFHYDFFESEGILLSVSTAESYSHFGDRAAVAKEGGIGKSG